MRSDFGGGYCCDYVLNRKKVNILGHLEKTLLEKINSPAELKKLNIKGLNRLSMEIRGFLIDSISRTGGHLASNLGIVELTLALHYCLDSPEDKIVWDVGHQCYVHKMLTGRRGEFSSLRQLDGLSGFPKTAESPHDCFNTGHSSTSISAALGIAASRDIAGDDFKVAAVIGDGAMTGGLAYEGMNNVCGLNTNMMVILNDNQMSISENVGGLSTHLNNIRTNPKYLGAKRNVSRALNQVPLLGSQVGKALGKTKDSLRHALLPGTMFEEMGFKYIGPVDGHNISQLINVINRVKDIEGPVMLHVYTEKGKGYHYAEKYPGAFHGIDKFDVQTGRPLKNKLWDTYSDVFGKKITKLASENDKLVAITAAMPDGCALKQFAKKFPNRFFDVGIAEAHAATFAAGLASNGHIPVFAVYSTFLKRAYDQLIHDICLQNLHVVLMVDRAGIVGADGETHQGIYDLSYLTHLPNMTVMSPKNKREFEAMIEFATTHDAPIALRYSKDAASMVYGHTDEPIKLGKSETLEHGEKIALVSFGTMMEKVYELYKLLAAAGHNPTLINARFAKPLDMDMVRELSTYEQVFTFEDNELISGFGTQVMNGFAEIGAAPKLFKKFGLPDEFVQQGSREQIFDRYGLTPEKMFSDILDMQKGE